MPVLNLKPTHRIVTNCYRALLDSYSLRHGVREAKDRGIVFDTDLNELKGKSINFNGVL